MTFVDEMKTLLMEKFGTSCQNDGVLACNFCTNYKLQTGKTLSSFSCDGAALQENP